MPEYLAPGVYVEEIEIGAKPIEGVSTSTAGFIGETERGPLVPRLVTGMEQYLRLYGGYVQGSYLPYAVSGFFSNGGQRCFISRVVGKDCKPASRNIPGKNGGAAAFEPKEVITFIITDKTLDKLIKSAKMPEEDVKKLEDLKNQKFSNEKKFLDAVKEKFEDKEVFNKYKSKISEYAREETTISSGGGESRGGSSKAAIINAKGPGEYGNRIGVKIEPASLYNRNEKLFKLTVMYWKASPPKPVVDPTDPAMQRDKNRREPALLEVYDNLSPDSSTSDFYEKKVNGISALIEVTAFSDATLTLQEEIHLLEGGSDGAEPTFSDYKGSNKQGERTGLNAFREIDEISIVCVPDENKDKLDGLTEAIVEHCELMKDRFAILQARQDAGLISELEPPNIDSKYAAYYYPWIYIMDPFLNTPKLVPPGGHVAGIYARSDVERGVHKAPANEVVRGALKLQFPLTKGEQDLLNPRGVNCISLFRGRGIRVWGARTTSSDALWKYLNVRRLFLYVEESIEEGTQWVVFEPNNEKLWSRVKQTVTNFLTRVWRDGALMGTTADEAFFVKCDRTTMTQDDIDNGRLIVMIGIAPVKPAEFVIFRIAQWASGSEIME